jgi:dephospho-CoA kinase
MVAPRNPTSEDRSLPFVIGLTGPIGCGKSTVAAMLGELGGAVIDADQLARAATELGHPSLIAIRARFGDSVFAADGSLDRAALSAVVFDEDQQALGDLERIVHPEVRRLLDAQLAQMTAAGVPFVVIEAIKLIEGGLAERCTEVWIVECDPAAQRSRLVGRGATDQDADRRIATQGAGLGDRLAASLGAREGVRRITTSGTLEQTRTTVEDALADALEPILIDD